MKISLNESLNEFKPNEFVSNWFFDEFRMNESNNKVWM